MENESARLLAEYVTGSDDAARQIVDRYTRRLIGLVQNRLSDKLQRRVDAEDVVQSTFRSFFRKAENQEFSLRRSGDLWRLLAAFAVNKTMKRVEFEQAQKRDFRMEESSLHGKSGLPQCFPLAAFDAAPSAEQAAVLIEELATFMNEQTARDRRILERRLQDESVEAIACADNIRVSESTVRRVLRAARNELAERLRGD